VLARPVARHRRMADLESSDSALHPMYLQGAISHQLAICPTDGTGVVQPRGFVVVFDLGRRGTLGPRVGRPSGHGGGWAWPLVVGYPSQVRESDGHDRLVVGSRGTDSAGEGQVPGKLRRSLRSRAFRRRLGSTAPTAECRRSAPGRGDHGSPGRLAHGQSRGHHSLQTAYVDASVSGEVVVLDVRGRVRACPGRRSRTRLRQPPSIFGSELGWRWCHAGLAGCHVGRYLSYEPW